MPSPPFKSYRLLFVLLATIVTIVACSPTPELTESESPKTLTDLADRIGELPADTAVSLLFAVSVNHGMITKVAPNRRELTFTTGEISSIVAFTDRPERHAFSLTAAQLSTVWESGSDSFSVDPPNAIIEDSRGRVGVTEVTGFALVSEAVTIQLDRMSYKSLDAGDILDGEVSDLTLFIDSDAFKLTVLGSLSDFSRRQKRVFRWTVNFGRLVVEATIGRSER